MLSDEFRRRFGKEPKIFSAPGRVNLIGEHTDYNQGYVLPIAIQQRTRVAVAPRDDRVIVCHSMNLEEEKSISLDAPARARTGSWLDYVEGMARVLAERGIPIGGAELLIASEVPPGAGLSSSASLELSVGLALCSLSGTTPPAVDLALVGQSVEHEYVGVQCGIMDQLICALGRAGHALLIDCKSLETTQVPIPPFEARIVVCDTRVRHRHADSGYNLRRTECEQAVHLLQQAGMNIDSLSDLGVAQLAAVERHLTPLLLRRVRHVVSENARTRGSVDALRRGHLPGLGRMMTGSHLSLRDDYEVSCPELDFVVEVGLSEASVLGARMTGGGFGGAAILLVKSAGVAALTSTLRKRFSDRFGVEPHLYVTESADGMRAESEPAEP
jgi:galactokinase